ncbi:MAG: TM0106 family RecB-like putative nuclease [Caulobacteraceae bacterium]|nr:MAG: TM0106 family RecB-like putative nuclease [Caulobacteraceae bacterium]
MPTNITASLLYDLVQCPKRVELDLFGKDTDRDEVSPFVAMLWQRGTLYEHDVMKGGGLEALDLSQMDSIDQERLTLEAMRRGEPLIYSGRISANDLLGVPDLLRREGTGYVPMDIKSGRGEEGGSDDEDGKPKLHYAVQLALYVDVLERLGMSAGRRGLILDSRGHEVTYDLAAARGSRKAESLWDEYQAILATARSIADRTFVPKGALASSCKLCHWYTACTKTLRAEDDLTLIPVLGRAIRDAMEPTLPTVAALAACNPDALITNGKTPFKGVGEDRLRTFHARAILLKDPNAKPYLKAPVSLPVSEVEYFFDIEVDPLRDFTYLHGIVERRGGDTANERFISFFTDDETPKAERDAFAGAVAHLTGVPTATIWYYSKYERTLYRKLQVRYPDVCSAEAIEALFDPARAVDLYNDVVTKATEWPTNDQSIKTLAKYLGFSWRDTNPSGAASIEWFDQWVRTRDPAVRARILDYNEDDCKATRVLLDGIRSLGS